MAMNGTGRFRVVVAGGGVAAVEGLLALRDLAGDRVETVLVAPGPDFVLPALAVAEPFGSAAPERIPLAKVAEDTGAMLWPDSLAGIDRNRRILRTTGGDSLPFDAALLAIGARRMSGVPGALTYRSGVDNGALASLLREAVRGEISRLAFAVPDSVHWPLAIYDLALLTAGHLRERGADVRVCVITPEARPLGLFGRRASDAVASLLSRSGVDLRTSQTAVSFARGRLELDTGTKLPFDRVVSLPTLRVPGLIGVSQGPHGFIGTDRRMRVENRPRVYAAGDSTWYPIKQGGIAAQQADVAARAIAGLAGAPVDAEEFEPVLRAALLTGDHPLYLRSEVGERDHASVVSEEPLWWPPAKVAGRYLAGYLRGDDRGAPAGALEDLRPDGIEPGEHDDAVAVALRAADLDAADRDFRGALQWLQVAEDLDITLPSSYAERRRRWRREAGAGSRT
jgi:sulfide:quinone oxidoreductase